MRDVLIHQMFSKMSAAVGRSTPGPGHYFDADAGERNRDGPPASIDDEEPWWRAAPEARA